VLEAPDVWPPEVFERAVPVFEPEVSVVPVAEVPVAPEFDVPAVPELPMFMLDAPAPLGEEPPVAPPVDEPDALVPMVEVVPGLLVSEPVELQAAMLRAIRVPIIAV
jgi:hypothetical protein